MIEIVALFFLCRLNGQIAIKKGLPHKKWWFNTILAWFVAEIFGWIIGAAFFGISNLYAVLGTGLFAAFGGYLFIRNILENMPDVINEDIDRISVDDLRPPKL